MIYFIQAGQDGPIKIGVSDNPQSRLEALQTAHYEKLRLLGVIGGGDSKEKEMHLRFNQYGMTGEWFKPVGELLDFIHNAIREWTEVEQLQALVKYWRDRAKTAESLLIAQGEYPDFPTTPQTIEGELVRYAVEGLGGAFIIGQLYSQFKGQISKHRLTKLAWQWERWGWLTENTRNENGHKRGRQVTPLLLEKVGLVEKEIVG